MTALSVITALRERWEVLVIAAVLGLLVAGAVGIAKTPDYRAQLQLYVASQGGGNAQAAYQGAQLSEERVKSYTGLVTNPRVCAGVVDRLRLATTPAELCDRVEATGATDSVLIDVTVAADSPVAAADAANAFGLVFTQVVNEIEQPSTPGSAPAVVVRVVDTATIPDRASGPGTLVLAVLGAVLGLGAGASFAMIVSLLDTRIRSREALSSALNVATLVSIPADPEYQQRPLVVSEDPGSPVAEAYRQLRTTLSYLQVDNPPKSIVFTSSVESEGKSTTVANLALALGAAGTNVLVIEADLRRPGLSSMFGLERAVGLTTVLSGRTELESALQRYGRTGVTVLASGVLPPNPSELLASQQMRDLLDRAAASFDLILVDTPPLLPVTDAASLSASTDGVVVVCRCTGTTSHNVHAAASSLANASANVLGGVLTMSPLRTQRYGEYAYNTSPGERPNPGRVLVPPVSNGAAGSTRPRPRPRSVDR